RPFAPGEINALDAVGDDAVPGCVDKLAGHDLHLPANAAAPDAVVAHGANRAADVAAVSVVVVGIARVVDRVDPVHVVHITVAVVVDPVTGDFARIDPHIPGQIFVGVTCAGVDHRNDDVGGRILHLPAFGCVNVRVRHTAGWVGVVQAPEQSLGVPRIIGRQQRLHSRVRLDI